MMSSGICCTVVSFELVSQAAVKTVDVSMQDKSAVRSDRASDGMRTDIIKPYLVRRVG